MSNMNYTPGPWTLEGSSGNYAPSAPPHGMLAAIRYLGNTPDRIIEETANASLIAAAPSLYEALIIALDKLKVAEEALNATDAYLSRSTNDNPRDEVRAALTKLREGE